MTAKKKEKLTVKGKDVRNALYPWQISELLGPVPEEEKKKVPIDGGRNYKHYLYGFPKDE